MWRCPAGSARGRPRPSALREPRPRPAARPAGRGGRLGEGPGPAANVTNLGQVAPLPHRAAARRPGEPAAAEARPAARRGLGKVSALRSGVAAMRSVTRSGPRPPRRRETGRQLGWSAGGRRLGAGPPSAPRPPRRPARLRPPPAPHSRPRPSAPPAPHSWVGPRVSPSVRQSVLPAATAAAREKPGRSEARRPGRRCYIGRRLQSRRDTSDRPPAPPAAARPPRVP